MRKFSQKTVDTIWHVWMVSGMLCVFFDVKAVRSSWFAIPWILINILLCKYSLPGRKDDAKLQLESSDLSQD